MTSDKQAVHVPAVALALRDPALLQRLTEALGETAVSVQALDPDPDLWSRLETLPFDVLIVEGHAISAEVLEHLRARSGEASGPGVVVIGDASVAHSPTERSRLVAAGVSRVLSTADNTEMLAVTIETLGYAEAGGGQEGPEVGGQNAQPHLADFLSRSPYMRTFLDTVFKVSDADASLLITGETGVGKERLALAIHGESRRSAQPFVAVNCGALPEALLESELFGHEKGAFTGADARRVGRFEQAHGGTIFLDEIGEMPAHLQVKLLTVLQRHEIRRVGGTEPIQLDVRVMAATNRNVADDVASGKFREDLYYRLNVISLEIPALRERLEDLPDLVGIMIAHFRESAPHCDVVGIDADALNLLMQHSWPGNVRELVNVIERAMLLADGELITADLLPESLRADIELTPQPPLQAARVAPAASVLPAGEVALPPSWLNLSIKALRENAIDWAEAQYLRHLLEVNQGHIGATAKQAGISTRALYERLKRHNLDKNAFKPNV